MTAALVGDRVCRTCDAEIHLLFLPHTCSSHNVSLLPCILTRSLDDNPVKELPLDVFQSASALSSLNLTGVAIQNIDIRMFEENKNLTHL